MEYIDKIENHKSTENTVHELYKFINFSSTFTKEDRNVIIGHIQPEKLKTYITDIENAIKKDPTIEFEILYNKILPDRPHSHRYIRKMKNLFGYIFNRVKSKDTDKTKENKLRESQETENDQIIKELLTHYCSIQDIKKFKTLFAKEYRNTKGITYHEKLDECIKTLCKKAIEKIKPEDIIQKNKGGRQIIKQQERYHKQYEGLAEGTETIKQPDGIYYSVKEILETFFLEHNIAIESSKRKTKSEILELTKSP